MSLTRIVAAEAYGRRRARGGGAIALVIFGLMFVFIGLMLRSMCWIGNGTLCEATLIGSLGITFLWIGAIPLSLGIALAVIWFRGGPLIAAAPAETHGVFGNRSLEGVRFDLQAPPPSDATPQLVASKCPDCGAPAPRGASACTYCGQTFL
jgi:hypothetical protein